MIVRRQDEPPQLPHVSRFARVLEGRPSQEHDVQDDPTTPNISLASVVRLEGNDLRCGVVRAAARSAQEPAARLQCSHAEVDQLDLEATSVQKDVLGFQVAVVDVDAMAIEQGGNDLSEQIHDFDLFQPSALLDIMKKLSSFDMLHDQVSTGVSNSALIRRMKGRRSSQFVMILPDVIQAHDISMLEQLHDDYLSLKPERNDFAVRKQRRIVLRALDKVREALSPGVLGERFRDDLGRSILTCVDVSHRSHPGASSPADRLTQLPRTDVALSAIGTSRVVARGVGYNRESVGLGLLCFANLTDDHFGFGRDIWIFRTERVGVRLTKSSQQFKKQVWP